MNTRCDLFCRIIDNYGDIGVCWRLARQLHNEHGVAVTLWVDDLTTFARLAPELDPGRPLQPLDGITIRHWGSDIGQPDPGDLVIEGFACTLPPAFLRAMATRPRPPVWLNLEYLSAEPWVEDCHALASVNPATSLVQHFWFPGFTARAGGLLREAELLDHRDRFETDNAMREAFWARIGVPEGPGFQRRMSLFSYANAAIPALLAALAEAATPWLLLVPEGLALTEVARWADRALQPGDRLHRGALTVAALPLLTHADYDHLLWACTLNAVRGEDSFVRAQWAGHPLLWHIYPQDEGVHLVKLEAFIRRVETECAMPAVWAEAMRAWNGAGSTPAPWPALLADLPALAAPAAAWARLLASHDDLASKVMHFYRRQVE